MDGEGLHVEALETLRRRTPVRAVYLTPHHHYPTTVTLSPARRLALMAWARTHRVALLEDDYDHEFHYDGHPVLPLASADRDGLVLYVGTLSKVLAPGLRLGFLAAPRPFLEHALGVREAVDRQGDFAVELAVAELLEEGEVQRHVRKLRGVYRDRRDALVGALERELEGRSPSRHPRGAWPSGHGARQTWMPTPGPARDGRKACSSPRGAPTASTGVPCPPCGWASRP
ncbi:PLP-dependent aminotransferase family protein [Cystobacter fuscus]